MNENQSEIRFKKMLCIGSIGAEGENNLLSSVIGLDELICFFYQTFKKHKACAIFINKIGQPFIIKIAELTEREKQYFALQKSQSWKKSEE